MDLASRLRRLKTIAPVIAAALPLSLAPGGRAPMFFHPARELAASPDLAGGSLEEVFFPSTDGVRVHGRFMRARSA